MSQIFTYNNSPPPEVPNTRHLKENFDRALLKTEADLNREKYGEDFRRGNTKQVEFYRKDFRDDLQFYCKGYILYLFAAYMHDLGIEVSP